jgi:hypothetical protein
MIQVSLQPKATFGHLPVFVWRYDDIPSVNTVPESLTLEPRRLQGMFRSLITNGTSTYYATFWRKKISVHSQSARMMFKLLRESALACEIF